MSPSSNSNATDIEPAVKIASSTDHTILEQSCTISNVSNIKNVWPNYYNVKIAGCSPDKVTSLQKKAKTKIICILFIFLYPHTAFINI